MMRVLEREQNGVIRFVELRRDGARCTTEEGVRGGASHAKAKYYASASAAESAIERAVEEHVRGGYREVGAASAPPDPRAGLAAELAELVEREVPAMAIRARQLDAVDEVAALLAAGGRAARGAALVLGELQAREHVGAIAALLASEEADPEVRIAAISALAAMGGAEETRALRRAVSDVRPAIRRAAAQALEGRGLPAVDPSAAERNLALFDCARSSLDLPGKAAALRLLLEQGADVNALGVRGVTPLLLVAQHGPAEALDLLLASGARPDARDDEGAGALHYATESLGVRPDIAQPLAPEREAMLARLLSLGLDPRAADVHGRPPLVRAAAHLDRRACELLIAAGADPDVGSPDGRPLRWAALFGNLSAAEALVERGAPVDETIIALAEDQRHFVFAAELRRRSGLASPGQDSVEPVERLIQLAEELGLEAARSAADSGDLDWYESQDDLDPDDLLVDYWSGRYESLLKDAVQALSAADRARLPASEELFDRLFEAYSTGYQGS